MLLTGLADKLADLPVIFFLKEKLKLGPVQMSKLGAIASIPSYVAAARISPHDRQFIAGCYAGVTAVATSAETLAVQKAHRVALRGMLLKQ
jgi:hypothetical protein